MKKEKIQKIAENVLEYEIKALQNLKKYINRSFIKLIKLILDCKMEKLLFRCW